MTKSVVTMTLDDAEHYSAEQKQRIIDRTPEHERDARIYGKPAAGSGLVFPIADEKIVCDAFPIPSHWVRINGFDFGWDHPFAAVQEAWDRDADVIYVTAEYREAKETPITHAAAVKPWGEWIPCAWPHDGLQHDKGSGKQLSQLYRDQGLEMIDEHATHEEGGFGTEAGVTEMLERMKTGRLKVFRQCEKWFAEKRLYRRDKGIIVKERDDLMSATRTGIMMKRFAMPTPHKSPIRRGAGQPGGWMG